MPLKVWILGLLTAASIFASGAAVIGAAPLTADFNRDGWDDLAIGVPGYDSAAGAVQVLYGGPSGLAFAGNEFWRQNAGMNESPEPGDRFGAALAIGDFDGDGYDDLAIGAPGEDNENSNIIDFDIGVVHVLHGSENGLSTDRSQTFGDGPTFPPVGRPGEGFGGVLAAGDFDGDGVDDLAVGNPNSDIRSDADVGSVLVLYGQDTGFSAARYVHLGQGLTQGDPESVPETEDKFGSALAVGNFNGDDYDDLAVAASFEGIGGAFAAGAVTVFYGAAANTNDFCCGLNTQFWHQDSPGIGDGVGSGDLFGARLASGDFDGDLVDDLAIGAPGEDLRPRLGPLRWPDAGVVHVLYGVRRFTNSFGGLSAVGSQVWHQNSPGILDHAEAEDQFGDALAAGDFNGDGQDDLAIGASLESVGSVDYAGVVHVLFGWSVAGLTPQGNQLWHQNRPGIPDSTEVLDKFGATLAVGDFDNSGLDELVIGVPWEDLHGKANVGAVHVLYNFGRPRFRFGPPSTANQFWELATTLGPVAAPGDFFGAALPLSGTGF